MTRPQSLRIVVIAYVLLVLIAALSATAAR